MTLHLCIMMKTPCALGSLAAALRAPRLAEPLDLVVSMNGEGRDRRPRLRSELANWGGGVISNAVALRFLRELEMTNHVSAGPQMSGSV